MGPYIFCPKFWINNRKTAKTGIYKTYNLYYYLLLADWTPVANRKQEKAIFIS